MEGNAAQAISRLRGMDEFKILAQKLELVAENRRNLSAARIRLPNYLFAVAPGCGVTSHIHQFARLLDELGLMMFEGEKRCFEWIIDDKAFETKGAFDRLLEHVRRMAGFRSAFSGVIGVDVEDWVNKPDAEAFNRLLDFVEDMHDQIIFVFVVDMHAEEKLWNMARRLSGEMPLELVHFPMPSAEELMLTVVDFLQERGFAVDADGQACLLEIMPRLMSMEGFDGYQSLDNLTDEIIYHVCSVRQVREACISRADLQFIDAPGGYMERFEHPSDGRYGKKRRIGFQAGRNA